MNIHAKQTLSFTARTRDENYVSLQLGIYDRDGTQVAGDYSDLANHMISTSYPATNSDLAYVSVTGAARDAVFVISVR